MGLVKKNSLMQPFLPGSPGGRGKQHSGKAKRISDDAWARAFPNCTHNRWLENPPPMKAEDAQSIDQH